MSMRSSSVLLTAALVSLVLACVMQTPGSAGLHLWWAGFGPVLPHESFPADCKLCHVGDGWQELVSDFEYDHEAETGARLDGAHEEAQCLRCHNDRGPVSVFERMGCQGCHEDLHQGSLGATCTECHTEVTWEPFGQIERHNLTRFPLNGVHAATQCWRCHPGAEVGRFYPVDPQCISCHQADLARAQNPNHQGLGWVNRCDRCHQPTTWSQAELDPNF